MNIQRRGSRCKCPVSATGCQCGWSTRWHGDERLSDELVDHLARAPLPQAVQTRDSVDWSTFWRARENCIHMARELREVRTSLRLIAALLPAEYVRSTEPEEPCMDLRITDLHTDVLTRLLDKPARITPATSPATVGALHELQAAGVICRDQQDSDRWMIRPD